MGLPYLARLAGVSGTGPLVTMVLSPWARACAWPAGICEASTATPLVFTPAVGAEGVETLVGGLTALSDGDVCAWPNARAGMAKMATTAAAPSILAEDICETPR